jgi:hypothetical protein
MTSKTDVAVVGGFYYGSMAESVARGFEANGCVVERIPYESWKPSFYSQTVRGSGLVTRAAATLCRPVAEARLVAAIRALRPSIVFFLKCDDVHAVAYRAMRMPESLLFAFHPDDPFNSGTWLRVGPSNRRAIVQLRAVDAYFIWSRDLVDRATRVSARAVHYLSFAFDPELHGAMDLTLRDRAIYGAQVTFVGNWDTERETWLRHIPPNLLAIWGTEYWRTRCHDAVLRSAWRGRVLVGGEMAKATLASAINLNVLRAQNKDACNMRTFEIPGCGGFMLHERSRDLPELFRPGVECDDFGSPDELHRKIDYYLSHPEERARIASAGRDAALRHTYSDWAAQVLEVHASMRVGDARHAGDTA